METRDTQEFGMLAVTLGYLSREQLRELIDEQRRLLERGERKRIGELCLERKLLTKEQVLLVLRAQGKRVLVCSRCRKGYNIRTTHEAPAVCKHCGDALVEPGRLETKVVGAATLAGDAVKPATGKRVFDGKLRNLLPGYEITNLVGRGGMGQVYRARDLILNRVVAVKLLASDLAKDEEYIKRFFREARTAQKLHHANIVQAYDCGIAGPHKFFLMEFVDGETLDAMLDEKTRLGEKRALDIVRQAAEGLDYAWREHKIIHRDIKPGNLLVTRDWTVKICDLGLSKQVGKDLTLTLTGQINCTPAYASPEQGRGMRELDCKADTYSLGCTLYHMLTGDLPFVGEGPGDLILKHSTEPRPNPQAKNPGVSRQAAQLTMRMMAIDPDERPMPGELARALKKYLDGRRTTTRIGR